MNITIRSAVPEDYPAVADIYNDHNEPDHHRTEIQLRMSDARAADGRFHHRLCALGGGEVLGTVQFGERPEEAPGKYWAWIHVHRDHRGSGVGGALHERMLPLLPERSATSIWTCIREDFVSAAEYLTEFGYQEQFRSWGAHLDLKTFEPGRFRGYEDSLRKQGIGLLRYLDLADDPGRDQKLLALQEELEESTPHCEPIIPKRHPTIEDATTLLESVFVAVRGSEYIGMASLTGSEEMLDSAGSGLTGVKEHYRNIGIATALKTRAAEWARQRGYREVNAGGAGVNAPILAVNRRLGFDIEPAWITFATDLQIEAQPYGEQQGQEEREARHGGHDAGSAGRTRTNGGVGALVQGGGCASSAGNKRDIPAA